MSTSSSIASKNQQVEINLTELRPLIIHVAVLMSVLGEGMKVVGVRLRVDIDKEVGDESENIIQAGQSTLGLGWRDVVLVVWKRLAYESSIGLVGLLRSLLMWTASSSSLS